VSELRGIRHFEKQKDPMKKILSITLFLMLCAIASAQPRPQQPTKTLTTEEYEPKSSLVTKETRVTRAKFPFVDVHSHHQNPRDERVEQLVKDMDGMNMKVMVNLSGGTGEQLKKTVAAMKGRYADRFVVFANLSFADINEPGWGERQAKRLEEDVKSGAQGLKIFKNLGMDLKYSNGERVKVDDPILDPVWAMCAKLKIPVLIHIAEPGVFFDPIDRFNERWLELNQFPGRARPPEKYPTFETLMTERNNLLKKHPGTNFILAHLGYHGNDLERLGKLFDAYPNVYVDNAAVLAELGRQPYAAYDFHVKYQDRILFGKDIYEVSEYHAYFRVYETRDEYIEYYRKRHAFWRIYGFKLPDEVLKKVYYKNAVRLIPGLNPKLFPK
jgi:predicted TIM-barrel fold metal-dependent hydrolase